MAETHPDQHHQTAIESDADEVCSTNTGISVAEPSTMALDEFKRDVKQWMELDNVIKQFKTMAKEKVKSQKVLTERIMAFMSMYRIEDLNTREGKLRYKVTKVKPPAPRHPVIKERLETIFKDDPEMCKSIMQQVFPETLSGGAQTSGTAPTSTVAAGVQFKPKLKRLKGTRKVVTLN
jgi:hypothetical protein